MNKLGSILGATAVFWLCVLFGPGLIYIFNYISFSITGGASGLIYNATIIFIPCIACGVAYTLAYKIAQHGVTAFANAIIAIVIYVISAVYDFSWYDYSKGISDILVIIVLVICAILDRIDMFDELIN